MLTVKGNQGVKQALDQYFLPEELEGVECEVCQSKTIQFKGPRISRLPPVLTFCLNRIELDYTTWERKKINDRFEFPLELDMSNFVDYDEDCISAQ
jgi:ubiquitin carboxyl-terminal hydrolase 40